ncbi:hypothetical protein F0562_010240 [Nyssa sinensis]|uniref:Cyclin N-terminal domain-containing protein n=1 Tax=Nyssa sinensis TaxID=561372 RepID=A0A5J5A3C2_9ASTE|nr:hypothetical protein F0562_010240 [Nyssa sinensis]
MDHNPKEIDYDPMHPILQQHEIQAFERHFNVESEFMAAEGYSNSGNNVILRRISVSIIEKLSAGYDEFDAFVPYLALNYYDRFLSIKGEIPVVYINAPNIENLKVFALCCLSIAGKLRTKSFSLVEFLKNRKLHTSYQVIMSTELKILQALEWRMRSLTAICFMEYFLPFFRLRDPQPIQGFTLRDISKIIITVHGDVKFTEFRPSTIAASALLDACLKALPEQFLEFKKAIFSCRYVQKEDLLQCMEAMGILYQGKKMEELEPEPEPETDRKITMRELLDADMFLLDKLVGPEPVQPQPESGKLDEESKGNEKVEEGEPEPGTGKALRLGAGTSKTSGGGEASSSKTETEEPEIMNFEVNWPKYQFVMEMLEDEDEDEPEIVGCSCSLL